MGKRDTVFLDDFEPFREIEASHHDDFESD